MLARVSVQRHEIAPAHARLICCSDMIDSGRLQRIDSFAMEQGEMRGEEKMGPMDW